VLSVEIVTIGTELLLGDLVDTNASAIARSLSDYGIDVYAIHSVGDNLARLAAMLRGALDRAQGVMTSGGLGPTVDDLTKDAVSNVIGKPLVLHEPSLAAIERRLQAFGIREIGENNRRQALLPEGAVVLENPNGTAPGFVAIRGDGKFIACMPGVPREMHPMLSERLLPWLAKRFELGAAIFRRTLHLTGTAESELDRAIEDLFRMQENPKIAVLAHDGRVDVRMTAKARSRSEADALFAPLEAELRRRIGTAVFGVDGETLEAAIVARARDLRLWLATAESVTGGGIADAIVRVPGASECFRGGIVAYDNAVKRDVLGVDRRALEQDGAVSERVALEMARGTRERLDADVALATTGIAGPSGGSDSKPVGLVWFGLSHGDELATRSATFPGTREDVRRRAVSFGLSWLWRRLHRAER